MVFARLSLAALLAASAAAADSTQLVLMQPTQGNMVVTSMDWVSVTFADEPTSVDDVSFKNASGTADLGAWDGLDLDKVLMLTGKRWEDKYYGLVNTGKVDDSGSCCADTLRAWDQTTGQYSDLDLTTSMDDAFSSFPGNHDVTHTLDLQLRDGELVAFVMAQYTAEEINAPVDAVVCLFVGNGSVVPTKDGLGYFSMWEQLGTTSTDPTDSIYKIQHYVETDGGQEWHGNGVQRFDMADGTPILAVTQKELNQAVLISDPWSFSSADGGGQILQRFGTPDGERDGIAHTFGINSSEGVFAGVHNVWYQQAPDGRETVTIFVNGKDTSSDSWVYEFDINLVPEASVSEVTDSVFDTSYRGAPCGFVTDTQGGARPIGQTQGAGVWLVATGSASKGLYAVDEQGGATNYFRHAAMYDPFTFLTTTSAPAPSNLTAVM